MRCSAAARSTILPTLVLPVKKMWSQRCANSAELVDESPAVSIHTYIHWVMGGRELDDGGEAGSAPHTTWKQSGSM